ncbi:MAG: chloride channel protein [Gemmatimonadales bacterium]|nr:chloride channel protein [Gemmatimonadota bacterium]MCL4214264.1 chloride channel protein [Gemmatimonadales bacterium]
MPGPLPPLLDRLRALGHAARTVAIRRFDALGLQAEATLVVFAVPIGIFTALAVILFYRGIALAHLGLITVPALLLPELGLLAFRPIVTGIAFALASWTMKVLGRGDDGLNVPDVQAAVAHRGGRIAPRPALARTLASAITIGGGGSAGSEGPVVVIGATLGSWLGRLFRFRAKRLRVLVACGAAAGISAAFNAPLAGAFFALEEILGTFAGGFFSPVVVSAVIAAVVARGVFGSGPAFPVPGELGALSGWEVALLLPALGVLCAIVGTLFVRTYFGVDAVVRSGRISPRFAPWLGGAAVGILVYLTAGAVAGDTHIAAPLDLFGRLPWWTLFALAGAKILATSITLNSGGSGGVFTPALFVGAATGGAFGSLAAQAFPTLGIDPTLYALAGMGAMVAGATGAPITGILLVFEMTHDFALVMPLMLGVVACRLVMRRYGTESLYSGWLSRRDIALPREEDLTSS